MYQFIQQFCKLITVLLSDIEGSEGEEAAFEASRDFVWQVGFTGVDIEELRAHLDPSYWGEDEKDGDPEMKYIWGVVNNIINAR